MGKVNPLCVFRRRGKLCRFRRGAATSGLGRSTLFPAGLDSSFTTMNRSRRPFCLPEIASTTVLVRRLRCMPPVGLLALAFFCLTLAGCQLGSAGKIVASPWSSAQQEQAILELVPLGTPRDEVVERLSQAGIEGGFGVSDSVFYCDLWKRPSGEWWHINVALLFDQSGRLYKTRPAELAAASLGASGGSEFGASQLPAEQSPAVQGRVTDESAPSSDRRIRDDRRTPFASGGMGFSK